LVDQVEVVARAVGVADLVVDDPVPGALGAGGTAVKPSGDHACQVQAGLDDVLRCVGWPREEDVQVNPYGGEHWSASVEVVAFPLGE
jgi:hypothetical protein